jgi:hypothetical protein
MKKELISSETAKVAKKKGFNLPTIACYDIRNAKLHMYEKVAAIPYNYNTKEEHFISAPTQSQLQRWLREEHDIIVLVYYGDLGYTWKIVNKKEGGFYVSYEKALEGGLFHALKLI